MPSINIRPILEAKTPNQAKFMDAVQTSDLSIVDGIFGSGKAQPLDAIVYTPSGPVQMGDLKIGDTVCSVNGETAKVLNIYPQGVKQTYRITFDDGTSTEACEEHLWCVNDEYLRRENVVVGTDTMMHFLRRPGADPFYLSSRFSISSPGAIYFEEQNVPIDPYTFGVLLGDGCFRGGTVMISSADQEIIDSVSQKIHEGHCISKRNSSKYDYGLVKKKGNGSDPNYYRTELAKLDLLGKMSHEKFIPSVYLYNSQEVRLAVLQGLMDTDGTVGKTGKSQSFCTTSPILAENFRNLVQSLGGVCTKTTAEKYYTHNGERRKGKVAYVLHVKLPDGMSAFRLSRKKDKFKGAQTYKPKRFVRSIDPSREVECQCILIDHPSHLYITDHFITTHNTFMSIGMAARDVLEKASKRNRIIVCRPGVTAGEDHGFLPGSIEEKVSPFMRPLLESFRHFCKSGEEYEKAIKEKVFEIIPLAYMQGLSIKNAYMILDEAQNATRDQLETFISRMDKNTKLILCGSRMQCYLPGGPTGWDFIIERLSGGGFRKGKVSVCYLTKEDIVRHDLIGEIFSRLYDDAAPEPENEVEEDYDKPLNWWDVFIEESLDD